MAENLVRIDELARAVNGADAVGIAVRGKAGVEIAFHHRAAQALHVRFDGLRIQAGEKRIVLRVNFAEGNSRLAEQARNAAAARSIHRIDHEPLAGGADLVQIDQLLEPFEIGSGEVNEFNRGGLGFARLRASAIEAVQVDFNAMDNRRVRRASIRRFELDCHSTGRDCGWP